MAGVGFSRYDIQDQWDSALVTSTIGTDLVFENTSAAFMDPTTVGISDEHRMQIVLVMMVYAVIRMTLRKITFVGAAMAYAICETLGPYIPGNRRLVQAAADARIMQDVRAYFPLTNRRGISAVTWGAASQGVIGLPVPLNIGAEQVDPNAPNPPAGSSQDITTVDEAVAILLVISKIWYIDAKRFVVSLYVLTIAAVGKAGNVTQRWLNKVEDAVSAGMNIEMIFWERDILRAVWTSIGEYVDETNASALSARWAAFIPQSLIQLRNILSNMSGEGLTSITVIKKAMVNHGNFDWAKIAAMFPDEMTNVTAACGAIGANNFFGYSKDLGLVRSTRFKNIAWVAKQLLIRADGDSSLENYRGWIDHPGFEAELNLMITNYVNAMGAAIVPANYAPGTQAANDYAAALLAANAAAGIRI